MPELALQPKTISHFRHRTQLWPGKGGTSWPGNESVSACVTPEQACLILAIQPRSCPGMS
jgi:hypothetical protein